MTFRPFALIALVIVSACSESSEPAPFQEAVTATPNPTPNYSERDGDNFYYTSEISQDDRNAGKTAADVVVFRYQGNKDGIYKLNSNGFTFRCKNPCTIIKGIGPYDVEQNVEFNSSSVIGSAFVDAFNGFMDPEPTASDTPKK
jgi:hypothetical protein